MKKLFYSFSSWEEHRSLGDSAFIEMQFCTLPHKSRIKKIVAVGSIKHWRNDSLYIADEELFLREYSRIFDCGIYNNLSSGIVDIFGINYYAPSLTGSIIERLKKERPMDYEVLIEWLTKAKEYNGFYILGM